MNDYTRHYWPGEPVLVEAEVVSFEEGQPYGAVTVNVPEATDPSHLLDGVQMIVPQVIVYSYASEVPEDYLIDDDPMYESPDREESNDEG